jgi:hypothetical protein
VRADTAVSTYFVGQDHKDEPRRPSTSVIYPSKSAAMTVKKPTLTPPEVKLLSAAFTGDTSSARQILDARQIRPDVADAVYI